MSIKQTPYAVVQRLRLVDILVARYGAINRGVLMDYFGISKPQASIDLRTYIDLAPKNLEYDRRAKTYRRTLDFKRIWPA